MSNNKRATKKEYSKKKKEVAKKKAKRQEMLKQLYVFLAVLVPILTLVVFNIVSKDNDKKEKKSSTTTTVVANKKKGNVVIKNIEIDQSKNYTAKIQTNKGEIVVDLDEKDSPISTGRFGSVSASKGYDGLTWHRIEPGFVIQGGDPQGDGTGGYGQKVVGELPKNGYPIGTVAWAKAANETAGSGDSQFFIITQEGINLPSEYGYIGKVIEGIDVVTALENSSTADATIDKVQIFADGELVSI
jgi:cyclophilin family peptidyl-prolyl cis-trans isomerase